MCVAASDKQRATNDKPKEKEPKEKEGERSTRVRGHLSEGPPQLKHAVCGSRN